MQEELKKAVDLLRRKPDASDQEVAHALGLRSLIIARMWKIKAKEQLGWL